MIAFCIRLGIILTMLFCITVFSFGFNINPLILASVLICSWITIISFEYIFWWIFIFASIFGFLYYDIFELFTISILIITFLFHLFYIQIIHNSKDNAIILYMVAFLLGITITSILEIIIQHYIFFNLYIFIMNIIVTFVLFFIFQFFINKAENFIKLYTHGTDMRCHT